MNRRLILLFFTLSLYVACTSIYRTDPDPNPQDMPPPSLQAPEDGADSLSTEVILTWSEVDGASAYNVQVAKDQDFTALVTDSSVSSTSFELAGLETETTYFWRVNTGSESEWSETWSFSTLNEEDPNTGEEPPLVVTEPPLLQAPENGATDVSTEINLQWEGVEGVTAYYVEVARDQNFSDIVVSDNTNSTGYQLNDLDYNTTYYWRVNSDSESEWSEVWGFTTEEEPITTPPPTNSDIWVSAYLASWNHYAPPGGNWGNLPTSAIDWDAFTHLIYFAMSARSDGSLSQIAAYQNMNPDRINAIVSAAHQNGKPVIISIGGWGNYSGFSGAISSGSRSNFINNLVSLIKTWGFDGIDLDMEPIRSSDYENYKAFVRGLHSALQQETTPLGIKPLLTAATSWSPELFSDLQEYFDQINLMTYDFSGAWEGWISWHNSPVYDGGRTFPGTNRAVPSVHGKLQTFLNAGIAREKLGVGIDFYGYVWNGQVTDPGQTWSTAPQVQDNVPYHTIMNNYYTQNRYRWDSDAQAAYLSIQNSDPSRRKFISYDDESSVQAKIDYTRNEGIGGVIIWELSGGYRSDQPSGSRDLLLQSVKKAVW